MVYRSESSEGGGEKPQNAFRNDGSFLEMFKKLQEEKAKKEEDKAQSDSESTTTSKEETPKTTSSSSTVTTSTTSSSAPSISPTPLLIKTSSSLPFVGKRRGGRVLPTGKVKKAKSDDPSKDDTPKDAWSLYLAEVKRYKETTCEEDGKTRPLVK